MDSRRFFATLALRIPHASAEFRRGCILLRIAVWLPIVLALYLMFWLFLVYLIRGWPGFALSDIAAMLPVLSTILGAWATAFLINKTYATWVTAEGAASGLAMFAGGTLVGLAVVLGFLAIIPGLIGILPPAMPVLLAYPREVNPHQYALAIEFRTALFLAVIHLGMGMAVLVNASSKSLDREHLLRARQVPRWVVTPADQGPQTWTCTRCNLIYNKLANAHPRTICEICEAKQKLERSYGY